MVSTNSHSETETEKVETTYRRMPNFFSDLKSAAPKLNPDEKIWNHAKKALGEIFIENKDEIKRSFLINLPI